MTEWQKDSSSSLYPGSHPLRLSSMQSRSVTKRERLPKGAVRVEEIGGDSIVFL